MRYLWHKVFKFDSLTKLKGSYADDSFNSIQFNCYWQERDNSLSHFRYAGKSPEDIVAKEAVHSCPLSCPCQIVDGYCVECIGGFAIQMNRTFPGSH